jgi:hypothetical protein
MDISFLHRDTTGLPGAIGLMSAPGRERSLAADLDELAREHGCAALAERESKRFPDIKLFLCQSSAVDVTGLMSGSRTAYLIEMM